MMGSFSDRKSGLEKTETYGLPDEAGMFKHPFSVTDALISGHRFNLSDPLPDTRPGLHA